MSRIEVPKCINKTKFHVEISDEKGTKCSTKYVSSGENAPGWNQNETYIFKEREIENCTSTLSIDPWLTAFIGLSRSKEIIKI